MELSLKIERFAPKEGQRLLAVSDIHGNIDLFVRLMEKAVFSDEDELFILGDIVEKGKGSLSALRYFKALSEQANVHILMGNCDTTLGYLLDSNLERVLHYLSFRKRSLLWDICDELGISFQTEIDFTENVKLIRQQYQEELDWLFSLPQMIELPDAVLVHGGLEEGSLESQTPLGVMKNDYFHEKKVSCSKYIICGHMPTVNYCHEIACANPMIDLKRKVISIDGGNVIRPEGQMNVLIFHEGKSDFHFEALDALPAAEVISFQKASTASYHLVWDDLLEILEEQGEFTLCRLLADGREVRILPEEIYRYPNGEIHPGNATDYLLSVNPGERVSVVQQYGSQVLCKKDGVIGLVANEALNFCID